MGSIYALMAGINDYPPHLAAPLTGCLNDIDAARELLAERAGKTAVVERLTDRAATVGAVEDGIRSLLARAGSGDTAVFWFSGHGTRQPATGADLLVEATGWNQALVCADGLLTDKRLGVLLDGAAARGAHVVAVLDCCFSGGATRDETLPSATLTARYAPPRADWPAARGATPADGPARHLLLAASRLDQLSYEGYFAGRRHGAFTHALLAAVRASGPGATYRQVLAAADARVRRTGGRQQPVLFPDAPGPADLPFLADAVAGPAGDHLLRLGPEGWEVDCGAAHGLRSGAGAEGTEFTSLDEGAVVRVRAVRADRSLVEPVGWAPDPERAHPVALTALASPPATVSVEGTDPRLREALAAHASPLLRVVEAPEEAGEPHFRLVPAGGTVRVLGLDGTELVEPLRPGGSAARDGSPAAYDGRGVVDRLAHLARWYRLRDLTARPSVLDNQVRVEIVPWGGEAALLPDGRGEIVCAYGPDGEPPLVSVRITNRSARRLWCALIDLTDSHTADPSLFPGHFIGPGMTGYALDGDPVPLVLPESRPVESGAEVRDWLKLIVAEGEVNTVPFRLTGWETDGDALRLEPPAGRDIGTPGPSSPGRWTTRTIALRTVVP
ncbi:caspase domain-containing protein [Streptomyces sp. NPDC090106]|uniref:caspase family protein n=1 Tax=Streptomyces sp. NPDC090106 TaxID=3365946 RepID=UPI00381F9A82